MIHYSAIAMPEECYEQAAKIDNDEFFSDFDIKYAYEHKGVIYYQVNDYDQILTQYSEELHKAGIPHNAYPLRLDGLVCVARFEPNGDLVEYWASYDDYILTKFKANNDNTYVSMKTLGAVEWEDKWDNQLHYGRIHTLKQQIEGK